MRSIRWSVVFGCLLVTLLAACGKSAEQLAAENRVRTLQTELETLRAERDRLSEQMGALRNSSAQMANRLRELGEDVSRLEQSNTQSQAELEAARRREEELRRQQQQAEARLATFRQMIGRFRAMIDQGRLRVRIVRGRMVIELPAGILFDSGDARLRREGEDVLTQVAQVLSQIPDREFLVAGHTDNVAIGRGGRFADNWELSTGRAVNVARFLSTHGVQSERLGASGYGEFQPAVPNDTEPNRALNRRVEIVLMPNINELPDLSSLESTPASASATPAH
ncbi:MAG: OmpA family protein [Deltaproteobacteria bacterium]|nr:OmpA family protein [Deltaproteobacteria bacterium]